MSLILAAAAPAAPGGAAAFIFQIFPFLLIFVIFYFLMIRPQQKRMKDHQAMIAAVKKGDEVVTAGGIRGRVSRVVDDHEVEVEIAQNVKVRVVKSTLSTVINPSPKSAND
ncbi:preprotein translocase subunit YajC [Sphingomonas sp. LHG3406-1]|uniref:preprotein translocase subunit YajC n=1 Tax=Sphingomonas sp. LHG3406-1 TaxID=2804617 RepID=UPI00260FFFBD|nr:preprotein translocase subunit YajC [Sphingomonas sp. LHG3406-1]